MPSKPTPLQSVKSKSATKLKSTAKAEYTGAQLKLICAAIGASLTKMSTIDFTDDESQGGKQRVFHLEMFHAPQTPQTNNDDYCLKRGDKWVVPIEHMIQIAYVNLLLLLYAKKLKKRWRTESGFTKDMASELHDNFYLNEQQLIARLDVAGIYNTVCDMRTGCIDDDAAKKFLSAKGVLNPHKFVIPNDAPAVVGVSTPARTLRPLQTPTDNHPPVALTPVNVSAKMTPVQAVSSLDADACLKKALERMENSVMLLANNQRASEEQVASLGSSVQTLHGQTNENTTTIKPTVQDFADLYARVDTIEREFRGFRGEFEDSHRKQNEMENKGLKKLDMGGCLAVRDKKVLFKGETDCIGLRSAVTKEDEEVGQITKKRRSTRKR